MALNASCPAYDRSLAYSIPDLQFNRGLFADFDGFGRELDTNSDVILLRELSLDIPHEHGRLSDAFELWRNGTLLAQDDYLEYDVFLHGWLVVMRGLYYWMD